jgi:hypothetical protein
MTQTQIRRLRLTVGLDKEDYSKLSAGAKTIQTKMAAAATTFTAPIPAMTILSGLIVAYDTAQENTKTTKAAIGTRNTARDALWSALESECSYVQVLCDANLGQAANYADLSGFKIVEIGSHEKEILAAQVVLGAGTVHLVANKSKLPVPGGRKYSAKTFLWHYTLNGGQTWIMADPTPIANTTITGLPLMTPIGFAVAMKDSKGTGEWSQTVTVLVH